eukprot:1617400-Rhodomonas_salina.2
MLAELIGVDSVLVEKEDPALFLPLDAERLRSVPVSLQYVSFWASMKAKEFGEMEEKGGKRMLHQLELQLARLFCRLASCKPHALAEHNLVFAQVCVRSVFCVRVLFCRGRGNSWCENESPGGDDDTRASWHREARCGGSEHFLCGRDGAVPDLQGAAGGG